MLRLIAIAALASVASAQCPTTRDCGCDDFLYSECKYPVPVSEVHANTVEDCKETCTVFAGFNQCSFFTFQTAGTVDENCKIYADETLDQFKNSCNLQGMPLKDTAGNCFYESATCPTLCGNKCNSCVNNVCEGYMEVECQDVGHGVPSESQENIPNKATCRDFCAVQSDATFMTYTQEEQACKCFNNGYRDCRVQVLRFDTDVGCA